LKSSKGAHFANFVTHRHSYLNAHNNRKTIICVDKPLYLHNGLLENAVPSMHINTIEDAVNNMSTQLKPSNLKIIYFHTNPWEGKYKFPWKIIK
jgi:hypothetical protein